MEASSEKVVYKNCHPELDSGSHPLLTMQEAEMLKRVQHDNTWGFTLIEILVVVLIIGILGAIALPQYQRAVLKSRFAALMPIAKSMADSNEVYYLEHGEYADNPQDLPVQGRQNYPDGTELELGEEQEYAYVLVSNPALNNNYIVYQKHSVQFPGESHCEALKTDKRANWLCEQGLKGQRIPGSLTTGYNTYLLEGTGNGLAATTAAVLAGIACEEGVSEDACKVTENPDGSKTKKECSNPAAISTCTYTTTNRDGSTSVCNGKYAKYESGKCIPRGKGIYEVTTDEDGNRIEKQCTSLDATAGRIKCKGIDENRYDANNNKTSKSSRNCSSWNEDDSCSGYNSGGDRTYGYDANNNITSETYRGCSGFNADGTCSGYSSGFGNTYGYDANNNMTSRINRNCSGFNADGTCSGYSSGTDYTWEYDANNNKTSETYRVCSGYNADGTCSEYKSGSDKTWEYDANNNKTSESSRNCSGFNADGTCSKFKSGSITDYTTSPKTKTSCNSEAECAELFGIPLPDEE